MSEPETPEDSRLRFRMWIAGEMVDETWVDASNPDYRSHTQAIGQRHRDAAEFATARDLPWLVEWWDPETDGYGRIGTDGDGMVEPREMTEDATREWLRKYTS